MASNSIVQPLHQNDHLRVLAATPRIAFEYKSWTAFTYLFAGPRREVVKLVVRILIVLGFRVDADKGLPSKPQHNPGKRFVHSIDFALPVNDVNFVPKITEVGKSYCGGVSHSR